MPASATPNAISRGIEKEISPTTIGGKVMPRFLNSIPNASVAAACRKNSTPPVTSSWLMGSAASTGRITNWCSAMPESATISTPASIAASSGQPKETCR